MNDERNPIDPFSQLNMDEFKNDRNIAKEESNFLVTKKQIKEIAEKSNFHSRELNKVAPKPKIITRSFSLFDVDLAIIEETIAEIKNSSGVLNGLPSGSDIIRAALHTFKQLSQQEKYRQISIHRGRGRR